MIPHIIILSSRHESDIPSLPGRQVSSSAIDPTGELTVLPRPLGIRFAPDMKRQSGQAGGEVRGGEEKNGDIGEVMERKWRR